MELSDILYFFDPLGLSRMGCPADEYDWEAQQLHDWLTTHFYVNEKVNNKFLRKVFREHVYHLFLYQFGKSAGRKSDYVAVADALYDQFLT